jgi:hypothetical protein
MQTLLPDLKITHSVSAMEKALGIRPRLRRRRRRGRVSKRLPSNRSRHHPPSTSGSNLNRTITNGPTSGSDTLTSVDYGSKMVHLDLQQLKTNSSIYDDDDVRFINDDVDDGSYISGVDGSENESYISDGDDDETETDEYDTQDSGTKASFSHDTTSQSLLRATREGEEDEYDENETDTVSDDFTSRRGTFDDAETGTRSFDKDDDESAFTHSHCRESGNDTYATSLSPRERTNAGTVGVDSRRVTFDDESTAVSIDQKGLGMNEVVRNVGSFFDLPRENPTSDEEKKENNESNNGSELPSTPRSGNRKIKELVYQRPSYISEVGMRIWTFFVMYCDVNNPQDNYVDKLSAIFAAIKFSTWEEIIS